MVGDVAEEVKAFLSWPEEGVGQDVAGGGAAFGLLMEHGGDEVFGFVCEVVEHLEGFEVEVAFADIDFSHVAISAVEGVGASG